jgi:hypothetical protein
MVGQPGQVGLAVAQPTGSQTPAGIGHERRYGARRGTGKRAVGPGAHRGTAGEVGRAGGWPETMNLAAETVSFRRGIRDAGDDSGRVAAIPSMGRQRKATQTFSARRGSTRGHGTVVLGGGHGYCKRAERERVRTRRKGERGWARERERERGRPGAVGLLQGLLVGQGSRRWQAGGGIGLPGASHAAAPCVSAKKTTTTLHIAP